MSLSRSTLYRIVVLAPLFLAAVVVGLLTVFGDVPWLNSVLGDLGLYLAAAWPVVGIPYIVLAIAFLIWQRRREASRQAKGESSRSTPDAA